MKICDLTCLYYPRGGGIKTYIDNKRRIYKERQISHILIAPNFKDKNKVKKISDGSLVVYYVPCFKLTLAKTSYYIFKKFNKIHEILEQEKPDVIEIGDKITTLLYKNKIKKIRSCINAKIFAFSHERADNFAGRVIANGFLANRLADFFTKRFIGSAEYVITNSNFTAEEIKR